MLAWTLIAKHNLHMLTRFFASVRASISQGTLAEDIEAFARTYSADWPDVVAEQIRSISDSQMVDDVVDEAPGQQLTGMRSQAASKTSRLPRNRGYQSPLQLGQRTAMLRTPNDGPEDAPMGVRAVSKPKLNDKAWKSLSDDQVAGNRPKADAMDVD